MDGKEVGHDASRHVQLCKVTPVILHGVVSPASALFSQVDCSVFAT